MKGKFGRTYRLDIFNPSGKQITIEPPFTIRFSLKRDTETSPNKGTIELINLSPNVRNQIYKDRFSTYEYWLAQLQAGYNNRLHIIFIGNIFEAYSSKEKTEWKTIIDCYDGMYAVQNGFTSFTVDKDTPKRDYLNQIVNDLPNLIAGLFGSPAEGINKRGKSMIGQSFDLLSRETDGNFFIDKEEVHILSNDEVLPGDVIKLDPDDLLSTPRRRDTFLDIDTLFEPQVQIGRIYQIESLEPRYNGQYKVMGLQHNAEISEANAGSATTTLFLYFGAKGLQKVSQ